MINTINYSTPQEQLNKLISQNLIIKNTDFALDMLSTYGYSNLIKSYRSPYIYTDANGHKTYRDNISFERIYSLFLLDKQLRNSVMAAMQDLEEHIKEVAADTIAKAFGTDPSSYLDMHNYRDRKKSDPKFSLAYVLSTLNRKLSVNKDPILHYATVYGSVPPWILLKSVYFSTIITFISKYKPTEHRAVAERLYDYEALNLSIDNCRKLMMDTLYICLDYRNSAAHGGRIYLLKTKSRLRSLEIFSDANMGGSGYGQLLYLLNLLRYKEPFNQLKDTLNRELTRHCLHYPDDRTYLANALDINIKSRKIVYVSEGKTKYHAASHCSGMSHVKPIEYDTALKEGYIPCKKCFGRL